MNIDISDLSTRVRPTFALLALAAALGACDGSAPSPVDAGIDAGRAPCEDFECGTHGACVVGANGPACLCETGYGGERCEGCYPGYHDDGTGACVLDERCMPSSCSFAGTCDDDGGLVSCACDAGYTGDHCETCATGYHRDAAGACIADEDCEMSSPCSANGTCDDTSGIIRCACDPGYTGPTCNECYPGYHADPATGACVLDQTCLPTTCSAAGDCSVVMGRVTCACGTGYAGTSCETCAAGYHRDGSGACVPDEDCDVANPCTANGTCDDAGGVLRCICAMGYTGETCASCADGYRADGTGACVLQQECEPTACSGHGTCDDTGGVVTCTCNAGYTGARCASCATGYRRDATDACVPNQRCADGNPCGANGTCDDSTGVIVCACNPGYTGTACNSCYPGYVRNASGACVIPERCLTGMCSPNGTCEVSSGAALCLCDAGYRQCGFECTPETVDQRHAPTGSCGTASFCYGQSFTAARTGLLTRIRHSGVSSGTHTLTIYAGNTTGCTPGGAVLYTQTVTNSSLPGEKDIVLTTPLPVTAGVTYTFKLENANGWSHPCDTVNGYAGGRFLAADTWDIGFSTFVHTCE